MPISQQFVYMMGGEIAVSSKVGEGSVFTFDIPVEIVEATGVPTAQPTHQVIGLEPGQPVFRILIVEDEEANRRLLNTSLQPFGFDLREATNGEEAVAIWQAWHPHLIWMDMRMPVMDGYEATKRIREEEQKLDTGYSILDTDTEQPVISDQDPASSIQHPVIIALTASAFEEQRTDALESGCDDFVRKPLDEQEIFGKMQEYLGIRYVYEESSKVADSKVTGGRQRAENVLTPEALAALPAEWLEALEQGAEQADLLLLSNVIEQIREQDARLADALAQLAEDFEYDEILKLLQAKEPREERR
jgi:CheY-like chemotaxis protein